MKSSTELSQKALAEKALREKARRHLSPFASYVYDGYKSNWHTEVICDALERLQKGEIRYLIIEAPPRHSKSVHVSQLFPAWVVGKNHDDSVIVASYSGDLATDHGRETRKIMEGARYKNVFKTRLAEDAKAKGKWNTQGKGAYNAVGVGGSVTGKGADFLVLDDTIKDRKEADSQLMRDNIWSFYTSVASTRLSPKGAMVVMQTRWHDDDIIGRITDGKHTKEEWVDYFEYLKTGLNGAKWVRLRLQAIAENDETYRKKGEPLWPQQFSLVELESKKKTLGGYEWSALYQQTPIDEENRVFKKAWFKSRALEEVREQATARYMSIDTKATKEANGGTDYIGICINYVDRDGRWNIIGERRKMSTKDLVDFLFTAHTNHNLYKIGIEKTAFTEGMALYVKEQQQERNHYLPIIELKHGGTNKNVRIEGLQPRYENGGVFHLTEFGLNTCTDLEEELLNFPKSANDDASDAAAYQLQLVEPNILNESSDLAIY